MKTRMPLFVVMTGFALILTHGGSVVARAQKLSTVSLNVTIEDTTSDQVTPTQVRSDALGSYSDGVDGVTAELGGNGNINILFWPSRGTPQRNVYFNHSHIDGQFFRDRFPVHHSKGGRFLRPVMGIIRICTLILRIQHWRRLMSAFKTWR